MGPQGWRDARQGRPEDAGLRGAEGHARCGAAEDVLRVMLDGQAVSARCRRRLLPRRPSSEVLGPRKRLLIRSNRERALRCWAFAFEQAWARKGPLTFAFADFPPVFRAMPVCRGSGCSTQCFGPPVDATGKTGRLHQWKQTCRPCKCKAPLASALSPNVSPVCRSFRNKK